MFVQGGNSAAAQVRGSARGSSLKSPGGNQGVPRPPPLEEPAEAYSVLRSKK